MMNLKHLEQIFMKHLVFKIDKHFILVRQLWLQFFTIIYNKILYNKIYILTYLLKYYLLSSLNSVLFSLFTLISLAYFTLLHLFLSSILSFSAFISVIPLHAFSTPFYSNIFHC